MIKHDVLKKLEYLANKGDFEELVNLYVATFLEVQPDPERLARIKKKLVRKVKKKTAAFRQVNVDRIRMRVLDEELELQIGTLEHGLTRNIILLLVYMIKHGHDEAIKEVLQWVKEHEEEPEAGLNATLERGLEE